MHSVSVAEVKAHLSKILNQVEAGEEIVITRRGHPIARIEPVKQSLKPLESLVEFRARFPKAETPSAKMIRQMRDEGY